MTERFIYLLTYLLNGGKNMTKYSAAVLEQIEKWYKNHKRLDIKDFEFIKESQWPVLK